MVRLIGLDLAWTAHHPSGICVVDMDENGELVDVALGALCVQSKSIVELATHRDADVVVCVDAPLTVGAERMADRCLAKSYGSRHAAPYHATEEFLSSFKGTAGPSLREELEAKGFCQSGSNRPDCSPVRWLLEVYPHACHVSLWDLPERILYKKGRVATRKLGLAILQQHLHELLAREWPALLADRGVSFILDPAQVLCRGRALKDLEDRLDALTCVYTAYHAWTYGTEGLTTYGTPKTGAIVVPKWPAGKSWLPV